ncbi:unnamed protein product [Prunus armeniaca]|uniref:Uncharacterized protein n=1 Tax=Prunus armeniaca TaxID=36596 RepID=A0A6J5Y3L8_PRUAR|nr:unnamed protein product [Prunus armeniaca]
MFPPSYSKHPRRPRKCRHKEHEEYKGKMKMRHQATNLKIHCLAFPTHRDSLKCGQGGKKGHNRGLAIGIFPQKAKNLQLRGRGVLKNTQTTPSDTSTLAGGPSTPKAKIQASKACAKREAK